MQFSTIIISTALFLASGSYAWTDGVANNVFYNIGGITVHEACTYANTNTIHYGDCEYWTDDAGHTFKGTCTPYQSQSQILCI
ncbi:hypothetical protein DIS24_g7936 [Lasiodiplodia hormozganensis]|uniref:Uncharacterized protein n=1 Tax=Lasiodiplodia hormozganensis TaxID=869390 RepID=A0AA39Y7M7_9PEZI|nr:hypothetical protein DIS24_g7936 [Lasiodiplodia hormozganensis]